MLFDLAPTIRIMTIPAPTAPASDHGQRWWRALGPAVIVVVILWLFVGAFGGMKIGGLSQVATNDATNFLPRTSEAAVVAQQLADFRPADAPAVVPAIVVAVRDSGISSADEDFLTAAIASFQGSAAGQHPEGVPTVLSDDGVAAQTVVLVDAGDSTRALVNQLRDALADPPAGLTVKVTGPAGQIADLIHAFGGIDGLLLMVAGIVVALILLLVYRGPLLVFTVLLSAVFALSLAALIIYALASSGVLQLSGMSQGILFILVFGAATDYALLLVSRYRQELRDQPAATRAMVKAWQATFGPITASAATVIAGVLCLLFSDLASTRDLGPITAIGIASAYLASMTFLPAALLLFRRAAFWPVIPHPGTDHPEVSGLWGWVARLVGQYPRRIWAVTVIVLLAAVALVPQLQAHGTTQSEIFLTEVDAVTGERLLDEHFPGGTGSPTVVLAQAEAIDQVRTAVAAVTGVDAADIVTDHTGAIVEAGGRAQVEATLTASPGTPAAMDTVAQIREVVQQLPAAGALVGGQDALALDTNVTSEHDRALIVPIILLVVFIVLALLLRALVAPLVLIATVVLSYFSTLGVAAFVFNDVLGFPGADPAVPLFAFVFLVALGIDYNIFLMTRVREEARLHGTRIGTTRGLALTGGVITSAGVVLAATFAALAVLPILFLAQLAFLVAFGVLVDTIIVRSLLVPALTLDIGRSIWWPSQLARGKR